MQLVVSALRMFWDSGMFHGYQTDPGDDIGSLCSPSKLFKESSTKNRHNSNHLLAGQSYVVTWLLS